MFYRFSPQQSWQEKIFKRVFRDRKLCKECLLPFGFVREKDGFFYKAGLLNGLFHMEFEIDAEGSYEATVHETDMPHQTQKSSASFRDKRLRKEYEEELWHIAERCFKPDAFKNELTLRLITHIETTYGDKLEFPWRKFPDSAIIRRPDNRKWYALFMVIPRSKLTGTSDEKIEVLNLRIHPDKLADIVDNHSRFPGYHMNKKNWASLCLDGSIPFEELSARIDTSYQLAKK